MNEIETLLTDCKDSFQHLLDKDLINSEESSAKELIIEINQYLRRLQDLNQMQSNNIESLQELADILTIIEEGQQFAEHGTSSHETMLRVFGLDREHDLPVFGGPEPKDLIDHYQVWSWDKDNVLLCTSYDLLPNGNRWHIKSREELEAELAELEEGK